MQNNQLQQHNLQHPQNNNTNPHSNPISQIQLDLPTRPDRAGEEGPRDQEHCDMAECGQDQCDEGGVVAGADAVVDPYAVVVEILGASVADFAVFAFYAAETLAVLAVIVLGEIIGKTDRFLTLRPLIPIHNQISRIGTRTHHLGHHHNPPKKHIKPKQHKAPTQRVQAGAVHDHLGDDDHIGEQLREGWFVGEAVGGVFGGGVVWGWGGGVGGWGWGWDLWGWHCGWVGLLWVVMGFLFYIYILRDLVWGGWGDSGVWLG